MPNLVYFKRGLGIFDPYVGNPKLTSGEISPSPPTPHTGPVYIFVDIYILNRKYYVKIQNVLTGTARVSATLGEKET